MKVEIGQNMLILAILSARRTPISQKFIFFNVICMYSRLLPRLQSVQAQCFVLHIILYPCIKP